jgi:hypothetical protein
MPMRSLVIGLIVAAAFPAGATAFSGRPLVPQGNSGANQYVESLPTAAGQRPTYSFNPSRPGSSASTGLAPAVRRALARQGEAGRQTAGLAHDYAPVKPVKPVKHRGSPRGAVAAGGGSSSGGRPSGGAPATQGPSAAAILVRSLTGFTSQGGLGAGLAVLLILSALGAGGLAAARRRHAD